MSRILSRKADHLDRPQNPQGGFTLIEVLIALLILSIGLLGLASLQTYGLRSNQMASMRTTATQLAYDIADRMRTNPVGVNAQNYAISSGNPDPDLATSGDCAGVNCTTSQMASYDIAQWRHAISTLPGGTGSIVRNVTGSVVTHTITIYWDEYRKDVTGTACGPDPDVDLRCMSLTL